MGLRLFHADGDCLPGCGRTTSTFFQELAKKIKRMFVIKCRNGARHYVGVEDMTVAVMAA